MPLYQSEVTLLMKEFKTAHPESTAEQKKNFSTWWNSPQDLTQPVSPEYQPNAYRHSSQ